VDESPQETVEAYREAIRRYKDGKSRGIAPTPGFCQCILGNDPDTAETPVLGCPEHGISPGEMRGVLS